MAVPLTFNGPSTRGVLRPIGEAVGFSCVVGIFGYSLGSLGPELQRVDKAAFGELHFEAIFALRFRSTQRRFRRFAEDLFRRRLARQFLFGFSRPPGLRSHAAKR